MQAHNDIFNDTFSYYFVDSDGNKHSFIDVVNKHNTLSKNNDKLTDKLTDVTAAYKEQARLITEYMKKIASYEYAQQVMEESIIDYKQQLSNENRAKRFYKYVCFILVMIMMVILAFNNSC